MLVDMCYPKHCQWPTDPWIDKNCEHLDMTQQLFTGGCDGICHMWDVTVPGYMLLPTTEQIYLKKNS